MKQDRDLRSPRAAEVVETVLLRDAHHLALDSFTSKQPSLRSSECTSNMVRIGLLIGLSQVLVLSADAAYKCVGYVSSC